MNYSKNLSISAIKKRVSVLLSIILLFGLVVGGVVGYVLKTHITAKNKQKEEIHINEQSSTETLVYGAYDDRYVVKEVSIDWCVGDLDFTPLDCRMPEEQQEFVFYLSSAYDIEFTLPMALIQHESDYDPSVISNTSDYGLMQINIQNQEWLTNTLGVTDYTDPYQNIRAGMFMLRKLFERYQDTEMVLMSYNMGEKGAIKLWEKGVYATNYTESILQIQREFNDQLEGGD